MSVVEGGRCWSIIRAKVLERKPGTRPCEAQRPLQEAGFYSVSRSDWKV